jgi:ribonuclease III
MFFMRKGPISRERKIELTAFEKKSELRFKSIELLNLALTHRSFTNEDSAHSPNNEKLEFLGDSILGMVVATYLYALLQDKAEGDLARIKSYVVSEETLSIIARNLSLQDFILIGKGEELSGGRGKKAILADAMEAVIGALYLDSGLEAAQRFVLRHVEPEILNVLQNRHRKDYKTILQEYVQKFHRSYPRYSLVKKTGPDHDRTFWISCGVGSVEYGPASGKNKKEAEQSAAKVAYDAIVEAGGLEAARLLQTEGS